MSELILSRRLSQVEASASMQAKAQVDKLRDAGIAILDFSIGAPDLPPPPEILEHVAAAISRGNVKYGAAGGSPKARARLAARLAPALGWPVAGANVVIGGGSKEIINTALAATLNPGDEVILLAPYWPSYRDSVQLNGGVPVVVQTRAESGFVARPADLEAALTPRTRWLILNNPSNPTGAVYTRDALEQLTRVLAGHPDVWILSDEIYERFVYDGAAHVPFTVAAPSLAARTLTVSGYSKSHAIPGLRLGYGTGPAPLVDAIRTIISHTSTCLGAAADAALAATDAVPAGYFTDVLATFTQRREKIVEVLRRVPGWTIDAPAGAFYAFPSVAGWLGRMEPEGKRLLDDHDVVKYLIHYANVATVAGSPYGAPGHVRFSFATSLDNIAEAGRRLVRAAALLR